MTRARNAVISSCGYYRYSLHRRVGDGPSQITFIMLNPSTADANDDDPTIRKCMGFARKLGYARIGVGNLFAWRATNPRELAIRWNGQGRGYGADIVGRDNCDALRALVAESDLVVYAWGSHGAAWPTRVEQVRAIVEPRHVPRCFGRTATGQPRHPLMLAYDAPIQPWV